MNINLKVSIIISSYNGGEYLEETISSALNQNYANFDVIVINDCSTDNTEKIIKSFANKHKNLTFIDNKINIGFTKSVNKAVLKSDSDYLIILGHDDLLRSDHIVKITRNIGDDTVIIHCNAYCIDKNSNTIGLLKNDGEIERFSQNPRYYISTKNFISSCGILINRAKLIEVGLFYEKHLVMGEWFTWIKLLDVGTIKYTKAIRTSYRRHDTNITNVLFKMRLDLLEYYLACKKLAFKLYFKKLYFGERIVVLASLFMVYVKYIIVKCKILIIRDKGVS